MDFEKTAHAHQSETTANARPDAKTSDNVFDFTPRDDNSRKAKVLSFRPNPDYCENLSGKELKQFLTSLPKDLVFSSQELKPLAKSRIADYVLSSMVKEGTLERLAAGLFRHQWATNKRLTPLEIAALRQSTFAGRMTRDNFITVPGEVCENEDGTHYTFMTDGAKGSFYSFHNKAHITMRALNGRMKSMGSCAAGRALRNLWLMGKHNCDSELVSQIVHALTWREREDIPSLVRCMPQWLTEMLPGNPDYAINGRQWLFTPHEKHRKTQRLS